MAKEGISTRKKVGCSVMISIAALLIIFAFCGRFFNSALKDVANFFVGSFGMAFYGIMIAVIASCSFSLAGKSIRIPAKYAVHFCLMFVEIVLLVHLFTTIYIYNNCETFSKYADIVYNYYSGVPTFGGIVFGTVAYGLQKVITIFGALVVLFGLLGWSVFVVGDFFYSYFTGKLVLTTPRKQQVDISPVAPKVVEPVAEVDDERARAYKILFTPNESSLHTEEVSQTETFNSAPQSVLDEKIPQNKEEAESFLFNPSFHTVKGESYFTNDKTTKDDQTEEDFSQNDEFGVKGYYGAAEKPQPQTEQSSDDSSWRIPRSSSQDGNVSNVSADTTHETSIDDGWITDEGLQQSTTDRQQEDTRVDFVEVVQQPNQTQSPSTLEQDIYPIQNESEDRQGETLTFDLDDEEDLTPSAEFEQEAEEPFEAVEDDEETFSQPEEEPEEDENELVPIEMQTAVPGGMQVKLDFRSKSELRDAKEKIHKYPKYVTPPPDLLNDATIVEDNDDGYREKAAQAIVNKLSVFGIKIESVGQVVGPTVTRYLFSVLSQKTRMSDFKQYSADLKACLEAQDEIRIEAPVEGTNLVGIEVANKVRTPVVLRTMLESKAFKEKKGGLIFTIGQEISGEMIVADLTKLPHLLVAGTTGSGKSVFLNTMIVSLMYRYGPEYLRFVMVDPKFVELSRYNGIPHMLTSETITNPGDALAGMDYLIAEMESRYQLLRKYGVANIADYNAKINPKLEQRLPYLVLVVDELADLMSVSQKNFETKLQRLAQKSRAAGIHIVLATQRPDVKTITGTIKTNLPCRIAFKVSSPQDSITILSGGGAEKLLGNGDMLYMNPSKAGFARAQGAYISDEEISALVEYVSSENEVYYDTKISEEIFVSRHQEEPETQQESCKGDGGEEKLDPYCKKALRFWLERQGGRASIASIQRALKIGFNRAGRIMDSLQKLHYVEQLAPSDTSTKPVKVLVSAEELDSLFPDMEDY